MKSKQKIFKTIDDLELIIKYKKSAVIFEIGELEDKNKCKFSLEFDNETFKEILDYIQEVSDKVWGNIEPKDYNTEGADYCEYYDKQLDNNGYMRIKSNGLQTEKVHIDYNKLYQFNKRKIESFIYDYRKLIRA